MKLVTLRKLHKWVALVVGIQLLLWTVSGLMFALLDHEAVSGVSHTATPPAPTMGVDVTLTDPSAWMATYADRTVYDVSLRPLDGRWVYRIAHEGGIELRNATDGALVAIDAGLARRLALDHYRGGGRLVDIHHHPEPTLETRQAGATWRATFDDTAGTNLYFSADDGALVAARTDAWRVYDFFWMLHTMDYAGRDDFNNPLVILVGSAALWIGLTGVLLLLRVFRWNVSPSKKAGADAEIA